MKLNINLFTENRKKIKLIRVDLDLIQSNKEINHQIQVKSYSISFLMIELSKYFKWKFKKN